MQPKQNKGSLCMGNRQLCILLSIAIIFAYLMMIIHQFGYEALPDFNDIHNNQVIIANDILSNLYPKQLNDAMDIFGIVNDSNINSLDTISNDNEHNQMSKFYLSKAIKHRKYLMDDFSFFWTAGDGSPLFINASKYDSNHEIGYESFVFCPVPKNGCSAWKQVMRRIKGEKFYLADDYWSLHSEFNNLEQDRIHRFGLDKANDILYDPNIAHAVFIRDPIERSLSAFLDKCIAAHWSSKFWCKPRSNPNNRIIHKVYSHFDLFIDSIVNIPLQRHSDFHWLPQHFICDLYKFAGRYRVYYSQDVNARYQFLMDIGGEKTWNAIGASGWPKKHDTEHKTRRRMTDKRIEKAKPVKIMGKNATLQMQTLDLSGSFLDKQSYHTTNGSTKLFQMYRADLLAKVVAFYELDYKLFNISLPEWICKFTDIVDLARFADRSIHKTMPGSKEVLSYGQFSTYYKDYDHQAIVNESGLLWNRTYELTQRRKAYTTLIYKFYEMKEFDEKHDTIISKIRGIAALSNMLTIVDRSILPKCFTKSLPHGFKPWNLMGIIEREKKLLTQIIDGYFNKFLLFPKNKHIHLPDEFVYRLVDIDGILKVNAMETFNKWRNNDKVMYYNIQQSVSFMREVPRKDIFWNIYNRKLKEQAEALKAEKT